MEGEESASTEELSGRSLQSPSPLSVGELSSLDTSCQALLLTLHGGGNDLDFVSKISEIIKHDIFLSGTSDLLSITARCLDYAVATARCIEYDE